MRNLLSDLSTVENIICEYGANAKVKNAALKLQLALLVLAATDVRALLPKRKLKPKLEDGLTCEEAAAARDPAGKIRAIRLVRERWANEKLDPTTFGLLEAKELVEGWMDRNLGYRYPKPVPVTDNGNSY